MFILYDLIFLIFAIIYLPLYLFKKKFHTGFLLRLGFLPRDLAFNRPIWIHAVSVGEALSVRNLIDELKRIYPEKKIVVSTITATGNKIAQGITKKDDFVTYLPLDFSFIVRSVIERIKPSLFIIAETEIWPNLIRYLYRKGIPVVIVNGKISDKSYRGYLTIKFLLKPILTKVSLFCVQTEEDARRLINLGVLSSKIQVTGNMKFDIADFPDFKNNSQGLIRKRLRLDSQEKVFVAGSTHPGEEKIILDVYKDLLTEFAGLRLLLAPRHPERTPEVAALVKRFDFAPINISLLEKMGGQETNNPTVFILDTVGELLSFYAIADIVFVGGSLVKNIGGHNILEPASLAKPVLFGPYMFKSPDIVKVFLENQAALLVRNQNELKEKIKYLLLHPEQINALAKAAKEIISQNQGASQRNLKAIKDLYAEVFI